ncbi:MAG: hypothetical protein WBA99_12505 [Nodosilinea sp.]
MCKRWAATRLNSRSKAAACDSWGLITQDYDKNLVAWVHKQLENLFVSHQY